MHMPEAGGVPDAKDKGGGWRLQPRRREGNDKFTTQKGYTISCYYELPEMFIPYDAPFLIAR